MDLTSSINDKFDQIEKKVEVLLSLKNNLEWKLEDANYRIEVQRKQNEKLEEELKSARKKIASLEKDFNKSKNFAKIVTNKLTPTGGMSELRKSVERYITEIDRCIETLEKTL